MFTGTRRHATCVILAISGFLAFSYPAACSALTFNFSFSGSGITSNDVLTVSHTGSTYLVTGITGLYNGSAITALFPVGGYDGNDNLIFPSGPFLDFSGLSFAVGSKDYNVFYDNGAIGCESTAGYYVETVAPGLCGLPADKPVTATLRATPEPSARFSVILTALAFGLVVLIRRRAKEGLAAPVELPRSSCGQAVRKNALDSETGLPS